MGHFLSRFCLWLGLACGCVSSNEPLDSHISGLDPRMTREFWQDSETPAIPGPVVVQVIYNGNVDPMATIYIRVFDQAFRPDWFQCIGGATNLVWEGIIFAGTGVSLAPESPNLGRIFHNGISYCASKLGTEFGTIPMENEK